MRLLDRFFFLSIKELIHASNQACAIIALNSMPTITELGIREGQRAFCFNIEKRTRIGNSIETMGGLHLEDAMVDPDVTVEFALVELVKRGECSDLFRILCTNYFDWPNLDRRDFPDVLKTKDITSIHNLFPNFIIDGIGPEPRRDLSVGVTPTNEPFENRTKLITPEGNIVGEFFVNKEGMTWYLEQGTIQTIQS